MPCEGQRPLTKLRANGADAVILFVHGFIGNHQATWGNLPNFIASDRRLQDWDIFSFGYSTRLLPDFVGIWSADAPLNHLALLLKTAVAEPPFSAYKSVCLIAHSMGGLIAQRALLDHKEFTARVSHFFVFAAPSAGLFKARFLAFFKRQPRDMAEGSVFIRDLRERWDTVFGASPPFRFWTIAGDMDEFVPAQSSLDPFPLERRCVVPGDHRSIVKPESADDLAVKLVISGICENAATVGPADAARLAIESLQFRETIERLEPGKDGLDEQGAVTLALALESVGRRDEAIVLLEKHRESETDAMGVLAGRLKRRWFVNSLREDAERALELYHAAYALSARKGNPAQAFYHGINVAFMELAYRRGNAAAMSMARKVLRHCAQAPADFWRLATEADADLILGDSNTALSKYRAARTEQPEPWQFTSMCQQAVRLAVLLQKKDVEKAIRQLYEGEEAAE